MIKVAKNKLLEWLSYLIIAIGISVIIGWILDIPVLKSGSPKYTSMKFNTALVIVLSGIVFRKLIYDVLTPLYKIISMVIIGIGLLSIFQNFSGYNLGIDELIVPDFEARISTLNLPGRPALISSFCFILLGLSFLFLRSQDSFYRNFTPYLLSIISLITFVAIEGYLFDVPSLYKITKYSAIAIHTSVTFLLLSTGLSFIGEGIGFSKLLLGKRMGDLMAKQLFVKMVLMVFVLSALRVQLYNRNLVSIKFGGALFATGFLIISAFFIFFTARNLNILDSQRQRAERKIFLAKKNLERTVKKRTRNLVKQNQQLEDFAHIVSHNLRGSVGNLDVLLHFYKEEISEVEREDLIDKFGITVKNIESTLNELLEIVQMRHDAKKAKELVRFQSVFDKVIQTFGGRIMEVNAEVVGDFSNAPEIFYSYPYLESVLQNMLSNALKYYSPERKPQIVFKSSVENNNVTLEIADNGLGIDMQRHGNKIFGLNKVFHDHPEAKGIGLFMTKMQIENMGGEISVSSKVNEGTTFKIVFNTQTQY